LIHSLNAAKGDKKGKKQKGGKDDWNSLEYSGLRDDATLKMALASKAFSWLSGSPADNEKLSVGKTAQFFGFVALRYTSGRSAQRGSLGRAFLDLATEEQKSILLKAVHEEHAVMQAWWVCRSNILRQLEDHLYTGIEMDLKSIHTLAEEFGYLNSKSALIEAKAFSKVENLLSPTQWTALQQFRDKPDLANQKSKGQKRKKVEGLSKDQAAQYEDLFAKCFSWLTGTMKDNQVVPLGQPAQFFGFVSIRHKSGHGASRGQISKSFREILSPSQLSLLDKAVREIRPWVEAFMKTRDSILNEMHKLREGGENFDESNYVKLSKKLGMLEIECALVEAKAYHQIRKLMSEKQEASMMNLRSNYILDEAQMEKLSLGERGEKLYHLCAACHNKTIAPVLNGIFEKAIAADRAYEYSAAMKAYQVKGVWTEERLTTFLEAPTKVVPGTKMTFQGLLNPDDRAAIVSYLQGLK
jgi:cytochrome c